MDQIRTIIVTSICSIITAGPGYRTVALVT